jgi:hypothetical protein
LKSCSREKPMRQKKSFYSIINGSITQVQSITELMVLQLPQNTVLKPCL